MVFAHCVDVTNLWKQRLNSYTKYEKLCQGVTWVWVVKRHAKHGDRTIDIPYDVLKCFFLWRTLGGELWGPQSPQQPIMSWLDLDTLNIHVYECLSVLLT